MNNIFYLFLSCLFFSLYAYFAGCIIFEKVVKDKKKLIFAFIIYFILFYLIVYRFSSLYVNLFSCLVFVIFYMILFNESNYMTFYSAVIAYTCKLIFRLLFLFISDDYYNFITFFRQFNFKRFVINVVVTILASLLVLLFRKVIIRFREFLKTKKYKEVCLLIYIFLNVILNTLIRSEYFGYSVFLATDFLVMILIAYLMMVNSRQENRIVDIQRHYNDYVEYSKLNDELITNYKMKVHENSNRLLIMKSMIKGKKKDLEKYIDTLLEEDQADLNKNKNWRSELKYIPFPGIKNFINYKLNKLRKNGAEIELVVSEGVKKLDISKVDSQYYSGMCTIIGVILDNMVDAIKVEDKKLASLHFYVMDGVLHGEFVNYFSGSVNLDKINDLGYTTKGKDHGVGLSLVKRIVDSNNHFDFETTILDEFFIQHVIFKIK